jgi:hypothetical protein
LAESLPSKQVVAGSNPVSRSTQTPGLSQHPKSVKLKLRARSSAAERAAHNRLVVGSNPAEPTIK